MKQNEITRYRGTENNVLYYVVSGELTADEAVALVAKSTHTGKGKLTKHRAYITGEDGEMMYTIGEEDAIPDGTEFVWAIEKKKDLFSN